MRRKTAFSPALILAVLTAFAAAQPRPNLALSRVIYFTLKSQVKLQGDLRDKIAALDKDMAEAARAGRTGEVRRLLAKGVILLSGREWTDELEFSATLVLRAEETYADSGRPYTVRVEQICAPKIALSDPLAVRLSLHKPGRPGYGLGLQTGEKVRDLAAVDGVGRDLQDEPCRIEFDPAGVEDGSYDLVAELYENEHPLGKALLRVDFRSGLSSRLAALASGVAGVQGFDGLRADVLYPADFIHAVNGGRTGRGTFDLEAELKRAESVLASIRAGRDPFAGRTGDMERHYLLDGANEIMPYRVYVPSKYDGRTAYPLIIALHGLGATQDSFFDSYGREFPKLAEKHGYIVAAPLGYRDDGGYGRSLFGPTTDPALNRKIEYSEKDVLGVLALMRKNYKIDESRIYLTGHSMGGIGTWYLGARHPEIWAALAPFSGFGDPSTIVQMKAIPQIIVHGDADPTVAVAGSRAMVAELKKQGVEHRYIEVPGGNHLNVVEPHFEDVFAFFDAHRKK